ncbi:hypothetical protein HK101_007421 [Irineochytrium annulatum]|nr:hypothetical protein HK101_007421 [Irineochytrium annulatum]
MADEATLCRTAGAVAPPTTADRPVVLQRDTDPAVAMENLLHLETMFEEHGTEDGLRDAEASGLLEGRIMGMDKGLEIGREVGFFLGAAEEWIKIVERTPDKFASRALKQLESVTTMAKAFPTVNDHDVDMVDALEKLRAKFKAAMTVIGQVDQKYKEDGPAKLNF